MVLPLEDTWADVVQKTCRGLGIDAPTLAHKSGLTEETAAAFLAGNDVSDSDLQAAAAALGLEPSRLATIARGEYVPDPGPVPVGLHVFSNPHDAGMVNFYLVRDPASKAAAVFDSGYDSAELLDIVAAEALEVGTLFLTHAHGDHVFDADRIVEKTGAGIFLGEDEAFEGGEAFAAGRRFSIGTLQVETRSTRGHSQGGITYVIRGLSRPVAIVGDALFAGSMGGPMVSYEESLWTNRNAIFTLPDETLICPGHGPLTSVALEKAHNPFFPRLTPAS